MTDRFDWLLYLDVADHMLGQQREEFFRSATSRAYYAVFCTIRDTLETLKGQPLATTRSVHTQVINALKDDPRAVVAQIGEDLDRLRRERNRADYRTQMRFTSSRAHKSLLLARDIQARIGVII